MAKRKAASKSSEFEKLIMVLPDGTECKMGEHFQLEDFCEGEGKDKSGANLQVLHKALLRVGKKLLGGIKSRQASIHQSPTRANDWCATVHVEIEFGSGVTWSAVADCKKTNANQGFGAYTTALAETRAESRLLRGVLGIPLVSAEEVSSVAMDDLLSGIDDHDDIEKQQAHLIRTLMNRKNKQLSDIEDVVGRPISGVPDLTKGEASRVLYAWNNEKKKDG